MLGAGLSLGACAPSASGTGDVLAAGQPAALLVWAVAPERLIGWPRAPRGQALAALPAAAAALPELGALTGGGSPPNLETLAARRPRLVVDYGDVDPDHHAVADRLRTRLGGDWRLIDGALRRMPEAFQAAGAMLDRQARGRALADRATDVLGRWRRGAGPSFYYARGADGLETAFAGALATEVLEGAGWTNVAKGAADIGRVSREQVAAWDAEVVVTLDAGFAAQAATAPFWRRRLSGGGRRILLMPDRPFGWIDRPPSVNRLLGCAWLAGGDGARLSELSQALFGRPSKPAPLLLPLWLP